MQTFTLPAGSLMRFVASSAAASRHVHRWAMDFSLEGSADAAPGQQAYGSQIGRGENQRIEVSAQKVARICRVWATHQTARGWETDIDQMTASTPDGLSVDFQRPNADPATRVDECVLAFSFTAAEAA